jgi:hypothetical protein
MATGVMGVIVLVGGAFLFHLFYMEPMANRQRAIDGLKTDIARKETRIREVLAQRPRLERWRQESLPADADTEQFATTRRLYAHYLSELMTKSNLASAKINGQKPDTKSSPTGPAKKPIYTRLTFTVDEARGKLEDVVKMLDDFYKSGMLHQIKKLSIQKPRTRTGPNQQSDDLDVNLTIEALVLNGAEVRPYLNYVDRRSVLVDAVSTLQGGPAALSLGIWASSSEGKLAPTPLATRRRHYDDIAGKNIFFPPDEQKGPDINVTRYVRLTDITRNGDRIEGRLYDRTSNTSQRLRSSAGFQQFRIRDSKGASIVVGKVVRLSERDIIFSVDEKYYSIHVGESIDEAMRTPLSADKVKELKGTVAAK